MQIICSFIYLPWPISHLPRWMLSQCDPLPTNDAKWQVGWMNSTENFIKQEKTANLSSYTACRELHPKYLLPSFNNFPLTLPSSITGGCSGSGVPGELGGHPGFEAGLATCAQLRLGKPEANLGSLKNEGWLHKHTRVRVHRNQKNSHISLHKEGSVGIFALRDSEPVLRNALSSQRVK